MKTNNNKQNNFYINKCEKCFKIPLLGIKFENFKIFLESRCMTGDYCLVDFNNRHIKNIKSLNNNKKENNIIYNYCKNCKKILSKSILDKCLSENHNLIEINELNSVCPNHLKLNQYYCKNCEINLCCFCDLKGTHKSHEIINLKDNLLTIEEIKEFDKKIINSEKDLQNFIQTSIKIFQDLNDFVKNYQKNFDEFIELNENELNFCKNLLSLYKYYEKNNIYNYEIIHNINNCINFKKLDFEIDPNFNCLTKSQKFIKFMNNPYNSLIEQSKNKINKNFQMTDCETNYIKNILPPLNDGIEVEFREKTILENGDVYYGEWSKLTNTQHGRGLLFVSNGAKNFGYWKNNKSNGYGIIYFNDGEKYEGEWKDDYRDGFGKYYYLNGERYEGEYKIGKKNGIGIGYYFNGEIYKGEWKNDNIDGFGIKYFLNGDLYLGEWKIFNKDGYGIQNWLFGKKYEGMFKNDNISGYGIINKFKNYKYEGEFDNYTYHGYGIEYSNKDIKSYEGHWEHYEHDGYGIEYYDNGNKYYDGLWKKGKVNGFGIFYEKNSGLKSYIGESEENIKKGFGIYYWEDGRKCVCNWKNDKRNGFGFMLNPDGSKYMGMFKDEKFDGYGIYMWEDGDLYEGEFMDNRQHGMGRYYSNNLKKNKIGIWNEGTSINI